MSIEREHLRCDEIGQAKVELVGGLFHLLTQEMKSGQDRAPGFIGIKLDVIAHGPPGSRWVLLEAPFSGIGDHFVGVCAGLTTLGRGPHLAYAESRPGPGVC